MLEAKNIHKTYNSGSKALAVLKGVNLVINKAEFAAVIGPSGAGKSTLLHILGGLDDPTQGEVLLEGKNIYQLNDALLARVRNEKMGFVFQFYHLLPEFTVLENVMMPALIGQQPSAFGSQLKDKAMVFLREVGLEARAHHFPNQLSGGEQQRTAIARALINKPDFLLCDEPTGNLDSKTGSGIIGLIRKLNLENKMTVIMVTHNVEISETADKV
ncbi:MAG: ABC transporter ATP-binding protein, partial [Candidatus Omnitrophica bacterium]|nr:ABC transporter ATP-binding protein [Candidatus Omnitrophota bacterium]